MRPFDGHSRAGFPTELAIVRGHSRRAMGVANRELIAIRHRQRGRFIDSVRRWQAT